MLGIGSLVGILTIVDICGALDLTASKPSKYMNDQEKCRPGNMKTVKTDPIQ